MSYIPKVSTQHLVCHNVRWILERIWWRVCWGLDRSRSRGVWWCRCFGLGGHRRFGSWWSWGCYFALISHRTAQRRRVGTEIKEVLLVVWHVDRFYRKIHLPTGSETLGSTCLHCPSCRVRAGRAPKDRISQQTTRLSKIFARFTLYSLRNSSFCFCSHSFLYFSYPFCRLSVLFFSV